ncbi:MAG: Mur ligase family protein [Candidatus Paceibacterota bacterium]
MNLDLTKIKNVHFIGIGGIGISAVARMMMHEGKIVTGQDMQGGEIVDELKKLGIDIKIGQSYENIPVDTDLIVYTIAIDTYDKELAEKIKEQEKVPARSYPQMLDVISKDKYTIAVSGTHGKTTTTAMIGQILYEALKSPMVIVGSLIKAKDGSRTNFIAGNSNIFVVEACEYRRSFLNINPKVLVITNIDEDHLDYYRDIEDIKNAFHAMAMKVPADGFVVCNPGDENIRDVIKDINAKVINWQEFYNGELKLKIPGVHNKKDAAAAIAASSVLDITKEISEKYIVNFPGTWRRFEFKGKLASGALIYDDYAHHPHEITATMEGFRELYSKEEGWKITVVFQPHLFSRTKLLLNDFAQSFKDSDEVLLLPIYYAREVDDGTISSVILSNEINEYTNNSKAFKTFEELEKYMDNIKENFNEKNIIVTMGAGEAFKIGDFLLKK